jgi:CBS domain containing-hemolysin-like protein
MIQFILLFLSVIIFSGLCSMSEAALLSLPMVRARILAEQKKRHSTALLYLKENMTMTIATIVVLNNAINIIGAIFIGQKIAERFGNQWLGITSAVLTFTIIVVSEVIPKTIGERYKTTVALASSPTVRLLVWLLRPLVTFLTYLTRPFVLNNRNTPNVTEEEIKIMLRLGRDAGTVEMDEETLCNRVFKLNDRRAFQVMKPIDQICALPADKTLGK